MRSQGREAAVIRLTLMKEFFDGVDEQRRSAIVDRIAARWFDADVSARVGPASALISPRQVASAVH
jgi:hypothetical protein